MADRFTVRWDGHQYKVSEPNIGTVAVVKAEKYDQAIEALRALRSVAYSSNAQEIHGAQRKAQAVLDGYVAAPRFRASTNREET